MDLELDHLEYLGHASDGSQDTEDFSENSFECDVSPEDDLLVDTWHAIREGSMITGLMDRATYSDIYDMAFVNSSCYSDANVKPRTSYLESIQHYSQLHLPVVLLWDSIKQIAGKSRLFDRLDIDEFYRLVKASTSIALPSNPMNSTSRLC